MKIRRVSRRKFLAMTSAGAVVACSDDETTTDPAGVGGGASTSSSSNTTTSTGPGGSGGSSGGAGGSTGGTGGTGGQGGGGSGPGPEPATPWNPSEPIDNSLFAWGVQTGDALPGAVLASLRTLESNVLLTVVEGVANGWDVLVNNQSIAVVDGFVHLELDSLKPDTTYALAFWSNDGTSRSRVARFRTALSPGASRPLRIGVSSCLGNANDPWPTLSTSEQEKLDCFLLLGDIIYADNNPNAFDYPTKFDTALSLSGLQDLCAGTSIVATWDDHEIDNNWSWSDPNINQTYVDALAAFRDAIPQREGPQNGIWRSIKWGDAVEIFVLDSRSERLNGDYISTDQMSWLQDGLLNSSAAIKLVANSVPIFNFSGTVIGSFGANDRWQGFPVQRAEILEFIQNNAIRGVLWLAGDVHFGAVGKVDSSGPGENLWEVIAGPAGSGINPAAIGLPETNRMPVVYRGHNWVLLEIDPSTYQVGVRYINNSGAVAKSVDLQL